MEYHSLRYLIAILAAICSVFAQDLPGADGTPVSVDQITDVQISLIFERWRSIRKRCYLTEEEVIYRRQVFSDNLRAIVAHNNDKTQTFTRALNEFSDMDEVEFGSRMLTRDIMSKEDMALRGDTKDDDDARTEAINDADGAQCGVTSDTSPNTLTKGRLLAFPPPSWDWRSYGVVTPVKNQGGCGSCWAFSTTGMAEGRHRIRGNGLVSFSEQQLVDCCGVKGFGCHGCSGAWPIWAVNYIRIYGLLTTGQYGVYTAAQHPCRLNFPSAGFRFFVRFYIFPLAFFLKVAIRVQPISVCVDATHWGSYGSGIFNWCSSSRSAVNHAVLAVGYTSAGHWIVKNSWGAGWGSGGYIVLRSGNTCGILNYALIGY